MRLAAPVTDQEKHDAKLMDQGFDAGVSWAIEMIDGHCEHLNLPKPYETSITYRVCA